MSDVICVGNIVVDAVGVYVDRIPDEGALALFDRVEMHLGGCAGNMAAWQYVLSSGSRPDVDSDEAISSLPLWFPRLG